MLYSDRRGDSPKEGPVVTFSYKAWDAAGNRINRNHLDRDRLTVHVSNLVVSGYRVEVTDDQTGRVLTDDEIFPPTNRKDPA